MRNEHDGSSAPDAPSNSMPPRHTSTLPALERVRNRLRQAEQPSHHLSELASAIQSAWSHHPSDSSAGDKPQRMGREALLQACKQADREESLRAEEGLWFLHDLEHLNPDASDALHTLRCHQCGRIVIKGKYVMHVLQTCTKIPKARKSDKKARRTGAGGAEPRDAFLRELLRHPRPREQDGIFVPRSQRTSRSRRANESPRLPLELSSAAAERLPNGAIDGHDDLHSFDYNLNDIGSSKGPGSKRDRKKRPAQEEPMGAYPPLAKDTKDGKQTPLHSQPLVPNSAQAQPHAKQVSQHQKQQQFPHFQHSQPSQQQQQPYKDPSLHSQAHVASMPARGGVSSPPMYTHTPSLQQQQQEQQQQQAQAQLEREKEQHRQQLAQPVGRFDARLRREELFVGGLPEDVDKQELQDVFSTYGKVSKLDVKQPERPPYYAFLEFEEPSAAAEAIKQQHKRTFGSSSLRVEYSKGTVRSSAAVDPSERPKPSAKEPKPRDPDRVRSRERPADTSSREPNLGGGRAPRTSYRVKVRNLPQSTSWQDLKDHFKRKTDNVIYSELDKSGSEIVGTVDLDSYEDMQRAIENVNDSYFKNPFDATRLDVRPAEDVGKGAPPPEREYSRSRSKSSTPDRERERARSPGAPPPREGGRSRSRPPPPVGEPYRDSREYYDREPEYDDRSYYPKRRDREHDYRPPSRERPLPERYPRSRPRAPERGPSRERARSRSLRKERGTERSRPPPRARSPNASPQRQDGSRSPPPARREERTPPPPERGRSLQPRSDRGEPRGRANRGRSPPPRPDRGEERDRSPPRDDRSYYSYEPPPKRSRTKE